MSVPSYRRVEFRTQDGTLLRGNYYSASGTTDVPLVIMTQGYALLKEQYLENWYAPFLAAGFNVLTYDHRNFGSSDGQPREEVLLYQQAEDYIDAVTYGLSITGPSGKVFIWGIGHSGGCASIAAARDHRMAGVLLCMPHINGEYDYNSWPERFHSYALNHRYGRPNTDPEFFHFWPTSTEDIIGRGQSFLSGDFNHQWAKGAFERAEQGGSCFENRVTVSSLWATFNHHPEHFLRDIAPTPLLWVATDEDVVTGPLDEDQKAFAKLNGDKKMVIIRGGHLENYFGPEFEKGSRAMIDFIREHS